MITNNNEIIHDMYFENQKQVDNVDKIGFEIGVIRQEYETMKGTRFGKPLFYIKSAGILFQISEESAGAIGAKIGRLKEIKEMQEGNKKEK